MRVSDCVRKWEEVGRLEEFLESNLSLYLSEEETEGRKVGSILEY